MFTLFYVLEHELSVRRRMAEEDEEAANGSINEAHKSSSSCVGWKEQMLKLVIYCRGIVKNLWKQVVEYIVWQIAFLPISSPLLLNCRHMLSPPNWKLTWNIPWQILGHVATAETRWRFINTQSNFTLLFSSLLGFHTLCLARSPVARFEGKEFYGSWKKKIHLRVLYDLSHGFKLKKDEKKSFWI